MRHVLALGFVSWSLLTLELSLVRVFDVVLGPNLGFLVLSIAMFALGIAGAYRALRPVGEPSAARWTLALGSLVFAGAILGLRPGIDALPLDLDKITVAPWSQGVWMAAMCGLVGLPFFAAGAVISGVLALDPARIVPLYAANLIASAVGCATLAPLIPPVGPGGALFLAAASAVLAAGLFARAIAPALVVALALVVAPFLRRPAYFEFHEHHDKFGIRTAREKGAIEATRWDPVSRIDVTTFTIRHPESGEWYEPFKHVTYDGGTQTTRFTPFDGDLVELRRKLHESPELTSAYFWQRGVLAAHHLKRDTAAKVLVIGTAGGQDTLAALLYGAGRVDALEMVDALVELVSTTYSNYIGRLFEHPKVHLISGEGRSFLRASDEKYDIIQVFSNNTSSTMGSGTSFLETVYLQTAEAYEEYFRHLTDDGVLQVNHHAYPRLITTASLAWRRLGRHSFQRHVAVFERDLPEDLLPTVLFKMSPWMEREIADLRALFDGRGALEKYRFELVENPLHPEESFLAPDFYERDLAGPFLERIPYRVTPCTDDRPFFNFLRRKAARLEPDPLRFLDRTTAAYLDDRLLGQHVPGELLPIAITFGAALLLIPPIVLVPFLRRRRPDRGALAAAIYFACLGCGFLLIELVLVQMIAKLVGRPLHAYSIVISALLFGAGGGSAAIGRLRLGPGSRWYVPFAGILFSGAALLLCLPVYTQAFLTYSLPVRLSAAAAALLPLGFFLGMPFPLGILAISNAPRGSISWAWSVNAVWSVGGSLAFACLAPTIGFRATLLIALALYLVAWTTFAFMRR